MQPFRRRRARATLTNKFVHALNHRHALPSFPSSQLLCVRCLTPGPPYSPFKAKESVLQSLNAGISCYNKLMANVAEGLRFYTDLAEQKIYPLRQVRKNPARTNALSRPPACLPSFAFVGGFLFCLRV